MSIGYTRTEKTEEGVEIRVDDQTISICIPRSLIGNDKDISNVFAYLSSRVVLALDRFDNPEIPF